MSQKKNNISAVYDKKKLDENELKKIISEVKEEKINGINVTVPFKKSVIPFLDKLEIPEKIQSVNTIYREKTIKGSNKIVGRNTDILGFKYSLERRASLRPISGITTPSLVSKGVSKVSPYRFTKS